ncbi:unnamed protein product, partial [Darwinula stevensoni]
MALYYGKDKKHPTSKPNVLLLRVKLNQSKLLNIPPKSRAFMDWIMKLRGFLQDKKVHIEMTEFLLKLIQEDLISLGEKSDNDKKSSYGGRVDHVFSILFTKNPDDTKLRLEKILADMKRSDIIKRMDESA